MTWILRLATSTPIQLHAVWIFFFHKRWCVTLITQESSHPGGSRAGKDDGITMWDPLFCISTSRRDTVLLKHHHNNNNKRVSEWAAGEIWGRQEALQWQRRRGFWGLACWVTFHFQIESQRKLFKAPQLQNYHSVCAAGKPPASQLFSWCAWSASSSSCLLSTAF